MADMVMLVTSRPERPANNIASRRSNWEFCFSLTDTWALS